MPAGFELAPEALPGARADVDRVHAALVDALGDVRSEVTSLIGTGWRGGAATAFREGYEEWERGAQQVLAALAAEGATLTATRTSYRASDDAAAEVLGRLGARLGGAA